MIRSVVVLVLLLAALAACREADLTREAHPTTLNDTSWRAVAINGIATVPAIAPTAVFTVEGVSGSAGCNHYNGGFEYDATSGSITVQQLAMTAMACVEAPKNAVEAAFTQALNEVTTASIDSLGRLVLTGPKTEIIFEVAAVPV
jgi:heat shock protein HslJ